MLKKRLITLLVVLVGLLALPGAVRAATYYFGVEREIVNVYVQEDGTMTIDYVMDFANDKGGDGIDYVDIGLPTTRYNLSGVTATVDGKAITDITKSTYVQGITLGLGADTIPSGGRGEVHAIIPQVQGILYPYTYNNVKGNVSFNFEPNYFGSQYVTGTTDLTVTLHLPPGIQPAEPIYYTPKSWPGDSTPQISLDNQGRVAYTWETPNADAHTQYTFGGAFPEKYIPSSAIVTQPLITINPGALICWGMGLAFIVFFIWVVYQASVGAKKRKLQYLPPKISIEGHGIKRGLTAVEAAILMEDGMDMIMTMILFGVLKKSAATVTGRDPLTLDIPAKLPDGLYDYETNFLAAFRETDPVARRKALQDMLIKLVNSVSEKMKGFSRKETVAYYKDITRRAWEQVEAANTPEVKSQKYDEVMEWTMLDKNYQDRTRTTFGLGPVFLPLWWGRYDPVYRSSIPSSTPSMGAGQPIHIALPNLPGANFAASVANGVTNFSNKLVGDITSFTTGVTNKTNPVPVSTYTGGGGSSGGGHSCACACACAGCACACAGGGR
jgi:Predicted membrane protein (DUF2207)